MVLEINFNELEMHNFSWVESHKWNERYTQIELSSFSKKSDYVWFLVWP